MRFGVRQRSFLFDSRSLGEENANIFMIRNRSIHFERKTMTKKFAVAVLSLCLSFAAGIAVAQRDFHDLEEVHKHVEEAIHEMETARAANHYDMAGHGAKAEEHLRAAEHELHEAIEAARGRR
jgi:hypothetical protein